MVIRYNEEGVYNRIYISSFMYEKWIPRWSYFTPPKWKIFKWAYHVQSKIYNRRVL